MSERRRIIIPRNGDPWIVTLGSDMADEGLRSCFHDVLMDRGQAEEWVRRKYRNAEQVESLIDEAWPAEIGVGLDSVGEYWLSGVSLSVFDGVGFATGALSDINADLEFTTEPELLVLECELVAISQTKEPSGDLCLIVKSGLTFDQAIGLTLGHQFRVVLQEVKE